MAYFEHLRTHGLVFFVRPHRECMQDDGFRERVAWDEINRIDGILDFIFGWQQIPCIGISELNMKDRVRTALTAVRLYQRALGASPQGTKTESVEAHVAAKLGKLTPKPKTPRAIQKSKPEPHGILHASAGETSANRVPLSALWSDLA